MTQPISFNDRIGTVDKILPKVAMVRSAKKFCNMWIVDPAGDRLGYRHCFVPMAQTFLQQPKFSEKVQACADTAATKNLQSDLFYLFQSTGSNRTERSQAGLCLRCYVSESILNACLRIERLFGADRSFTYRDLLPFVLNDEGKTLFFFDADGKTTLQLESTGTAQIANYQCFSLHVLRTFNPRSQSAMSLDNWAYLQTKQNPDLKNFLTEFGFQQLSDWALLNRARPKQLAMLTERDGHFIEVFHQVYRRDRQQQYQGLKRCQDPTPVQLQEMIGYLQTRGILMQPQVLITELRQLARQLRQYDIWSYREPLEFPAPENGSLIVRSDLPFDESNQVDVEQVEQQELLEFFQEQLQLALAQAIERAITERIESLKKSKGYRGFAGYLVKGLHFYYRQGVTLKEVAVLLGMTGWAQARRVLNLQELICTVRTLTISQVLRQMLQKAQEKGLTQLPPSADYLENLVGQIEALADARIFQEAVEEIQSGKNRQMKSVYAQQLCCYLEECTSLQQEVLDV
jgi:hypothetical protein